MYKGNVLKDPCCARELYLVLLVTCIFVQDLHTFIVLRPTFGAQHRTTDG